jgi:hypothetical protein
MPFSLMTLVGKSLESAIQHTSLSSIITQSSDSLLVFQVDSYFPKESLRKISGSHCDDYEDDSLLEYCAVCSRRSRLTFQRCLLPPSSQDDGRGR